MIWRLRKHKIRRYSESLLRVCGKVGILGAVMEVVGSKMAESLGAPDIFSMGWPLLLLGALLFMGGVGFALAGEAPTLRDYAEGESEEMPAVGKLLSGLLACSGGIMIAAVGFMRLTN